MKNLTTEHLALLKSIGVSTTAPTIPGMAPFYTYVANQKLAIHAANLFGGRAEKLKGVAKTGYNIVFYPPNYDFFCLVGFFMGINQETINQPFSKTAAEITTEIQAIPNSYYHP